MALGADPSILMKNLVRNLLLIQVPQGNNPKMVYRILGSKYSSYVRSIYVHSTSEIFADIVPPRHSVIRKILALAGAQEYMGKEFTCYIQLASEVMEPDFFRELTQLLIHGNQEEVLRSILWKNWLILLVPMVLGLTIQDMWKSICNFQQKVFSQDVLVLVVPHIDYHNFVPITLGTLTLGLIDQHLVETQQVGNLEQEWRLVHQAILCRQALAQDEILGQVRVTKSFKIPACSCITIPGFVKTTRGGYSLHAVAKPSKHATLPSGVSLTGEQYINLRQGSNRVGILLQNDTEQPVIITPRTVVCQLVLGNLVPKLVAPSSEFTEVDKHLLDDDLSLSGLPEDDSLDGEARSTPNLNKQQLSIAILLLPRV